MNANCQYECYQFYKCTKRKKILLTYAENEAILLCPVGKNGGSEWSGNDKYASN